MNIELFKQYNFPIEDSLFESLSEYVALLLKWNKTYNLTNIIQPDEVVLKHLIDSLAIGPYLHGQRIIDVGTGAGLPGIPLALAYPDKAFTLLDRNGKKTRFLNQVVRQLKLANVDVVDARVERYNSAQGFDTITSRAFTSLADMLKKTSHLTSNTGRFLAMKGQHPQAELNELPVGFDAQVHTVQLGNQDLQRHVVILKRNSA
jgi:16S rRNA (guanine527-N7)-methyltransferase